MVHAAITYTHPDDPCGPGEVEIAIDGDYGPTAEIAHAVLELCLFRRRVASGGRC